MTAVTPALIVVALAAAIALGAAGVWGAIEVGKAARSSRMLAEDLRSRLVPLAEKADVTVDALNAEILRVDLIVGQLEGAVDKFSGAAETVREVVDAPIHLVSGMAERVRRGLRRHGGHHHEPGHAPAAQAGTATVAILPGSEQPSVPPGSVTSESAPSESVTPRSAPPGPATPEEGLPESAALDAPAVAADPAAESVESSSAAEVEKE